MGTLLGEGLSLAGQGRAGQDTLQPQLCGAWPWQRERKRTARLLQRVKAGAARLGCESFLKAAKRGEGLPLTNAPAAILCHWRSPLPERPRRPEGEGRTSEGQLRRHARPRGGPTGAPRDTDDPLGPSPPGERLPRAPRSPLPAPGQWRVGAAASPRRHGDHPPSTLTSRHTTQSETFSLPRPLPGSSLPRQSCLPALLIGSPPPC